MVTDTALDPRKTVVEPPGADSVLKAPSSMGKSSTAEVLQSAPQGSVTRSICEALRSG